MDYFPTLKEIIEYYQREDILSVLHFQTTKWKAEMHFLGNHIMLNSSSPEELGEVIQKCISKATQNLNPDEKPPEYPTPLVKSDHGELVEQRYDWITEDDPETWQEAFEAMKTVLDVLDTFGVYYQIQFSGHRSLHLRLPAESFPKHFQGKAIADFQTLERIQGNGFSIINPIHSAINRYLPPTGHSPFGLRMCYATHPETGLVALPLRRNELDIFRPYMANIHQVRVDYSWFSVPEDAHQKMTDFLSEVMLNKKRKHMGWKAREHLIDPPSPADRVRTCLYRALSQPNC